MTALSSELLQNLQHTTFVTSFCRLFKKIGDQPEHEPITEWQSRFGAYLGADLSHLTACLDAGREEITIPEQLTLWWILIMEGVLAQVERGIPLLAVRYADLVESREKVLRSIFVYCELPPDGVQRALSAFDRDAQAGTALARENPKEANKLKLNDQQVRSITTILRRHPVLKQPDFGLPGALQI